MSNRTGMILSAGITAAALFAFFSVQRSNDQLRYQGKDSQPVEGWVKQQLSGPPQSCMSFCDSFKEKRDSLSKQLNAMKQEYGKLNCEMNLLTRKGTITAFGGWCRNASAPTGKESRHGTDYPFAKALSEFFKGKRVASFGDGPGLYKNYLDKTGLLSVYDAYDGAPYCDEVSKGAVKFLDLTSPQYGLPVYDWVMSLEVAEHIPTKYESVYIDNIVRHAKEGIVLSWAIPTQGGHGHVNGKSFEDVKILMKSLGFEWDETESQGLKNKATLQWLRRNVSVFRRSLKTDLSAIA